MEAQCLLSRQPIYDSRMSVAGYELRVQPTNGAGVDNPEVTVFLSTIFSDSALDEIVGEHPGIINPTHEPLANGFWKTLPKSRVVFAYSEPNPDSDSVHTLTSIASSGYRLALAEPLSSEQLETLGNLAHLIRIDIANY